MPVLIDTSMDFPVLTENSCLATALRIRSATPSDIACEAIGMIATNSSPA